MSFAFNSASTFWYGKSFRYAGSISFLYLLNTRNAWNTELSLCLSPFTTNVLNTAAASGITLAADGFYAYFGFASDGDYSRSTGVSARVVNGIITEKQLFY